MIAENRQVTEADRRILRDLAKRQLEISQRPVNLERRRLWCKHNSLRGERPMVLAEIGGVPDEMLPESMLQCEKSWARGVERQLRGGIVQFEQVGDDCVIEPFFNVNWQVAVSDYGINIERRRADNDGKLGSFHLDAPIKDLGKALDILRPRSYSVDRDATLAWKSHLEELLGDILTVRIRGSFWWTMGLTLTVVYHIGLQEMMLHMYDDPVGLHGLMGFFRDDHLSFIQWCESEGLLTLNNENDYIGSGGHGYTNELPRSDWKAHSPARLRDLWMLGESQETVGVSPEMFDEFVLSYQLPLLAKAGMVYYGCCEPVHSRWKVIERIPNLRTVSVSPWCDQEFMAEALGRKYVFARKPNPTLISTDRWDEDAIRADLRHTLTVARNCEVELAMKDVHTLCGQPERLGRWVEIAREEIARLW